jgi:hypothetical protein
MFAGHLPELLVLLVMLLTLAAAAGLVWLFGFAVGHGIRRGMDR